jgi:2-haloacid dehalogenase
MGWQVGPWRELRAPASDPTDPNCPSDHIKTSTHYFDAFTELRPYPDTLPTLEELSVGHRIALVSNIDDDLLAATPIPKADLICTAERARGYKPDGTLFRYLIAWAGVGVPEILHSGQSQHTDMVGGKPLGLTVAWINRRHLELHPSVPSLAISFLTCGRWYR